jgi:hypothetical protein
LRLAIIFVLALSIHLLHAQDNKEAQNEVSFVEKMRPHMTKIIGEEWTAKILGASKVAAVEVVMPAIPVITEDAKSTAVYDKKADTISLKPEVEQKFNYVYIKELYEATRQTSPNDDEIGKFMNVLSQGGTREGIYRSVVLDSTYGGMENWDKPVKSAAADFAVYFYEKYFAKKVAKKSFEGMSIYTLKRLLTERALDVADAFGENRGDLEKWYGLMSADFAQRFPQIWSNNMRKNPSPSVHKNWAGKVPVQHIKSEVIIKVHSALNSLI